mgnify:CR=1 FL=1
MLVRRALAGYAAAAIRMPYDRFLRAAQQRSYDIESLTGLFGASFEQVAHRLTTLHRPGAEGVPFFFIRVDPAGNVSKRLDGAGFPFAAHGGGCPLWNLHSAFRSPGEVLTQWLELPDSQRFFAIGCLKHFITMDFKARYKNIAVGLIVIDDQNGSGFRLWLV